MVNIDLTSLDFCSDEIKPRNNAITIAKALISIALLLVMVMSIAYPSVHVTCCIASTTVRVIPIATVDVHAHTILIIVEIHAKKITKIITINVEINNEFSYYYAKEIVILLIKPVTTNVLRATQNLTNYSEFDKLSMC